ncbi:MAG: N-acetyl-D-Glu racemase DgcA [Pseudomonadota bacterium]
MIALDIDRETWPLASAFRIARGSKTEAEVLHVTMADKSNGERGHAECVPYARYGETLDSVEAQIQSIAAELAEGITREQLLTALPRGAARNAVDCALWDLEAKRSGNRAHVTAGHRFLGTRQTYFTLSMAEPRAMAEQARAHADHVTLKMKVGAGDGEDTARIHAVRAAAPDARIVVDANEAWSADNYHDMMRHCASAHIALVEQPLPASDDEFLRNAPRPVPVCADESAHCSKDLPRLLGKYDFVNIKLDKSGGLTEALLMQKQARTMGFGIMVGCMVGTSLAMAPAMILAQDAEHVDLDGPLLLAKDRETPLPYTTNTIGPPPTDLWG